MIRNAEARLPRHFLPLDDANRKALRSFWRGMFCGVVLTMIVGSLAAVLA